MALTITQPHQLIVEGRDDEYLFRALIQHIQADSIQIHNLEGVSNLRSFLRTLVQTPGFQDEVETLGIVRDADANSTSAFQSVQDALNAVGLTAPAQPLQVAGSDPRVAALIVPHGLNNGALEDVCLESVETDDAMTCVNEFMNCVKSQAQNPPNNLAKAKVQAFLSSRRRPGLQLGRAADAGYWNWDHRAFDPLKQLLDML